MSTTKDKRISRPLRAKRASSIVEFGAALIVLLLVFGILTAVGYLGLSLVIAWYLTDYAGTLAANSVTFDDALSKSCSQVKTATTVGLFAVAHLKSVHGYKNSGVDLFIEEQNHKTEKISRSAANVGLNCRIDLDQNTYYYRLNSYFQIGPLIPVRPGILDHIPVLTEPEIVVMSARQISEHPDGAVAIDYWQRRDLIRCQRN